MTEYDRWFPYLSNSRALGIQAAWFGAAGRLVAVAPTSFATVVPHGTTCEDMKDTRELPEWTIWSKPLSTDGRKVAALMINTRQDKQAAGTVPLHALGLATSATSAVAEVEVWSGASSRLRSGATTWDVALPAGGHRWVTLEVTA